jgi:CRP-like cAMP-binding protein
MIEQLRATPLLSALDDAELKRVAEHAVRRHLDEGTWLFSQGDTARHFYLVLSGQVRLFRLAPDGSEKVIEIVSAGETFAEALMFLNAPRYPVCAAALGPSEVIAMDARDFAAMLRDSVETCFVVLGALSRRLRSLIGEIDNLTLHSARSRVARYLLAHCPEDRRAFALDVRKGVLASRLSIKAETFSRVFKQLTDAGAISVHGAHVTLIDRPALVEMAELADTPELGTTGCSPAPDRRSG